MSIVISRDPDIIFIHIPKNGGRYVYAKIKPILLSAGATIIDRKELPAHITLKELKDHLPSSTYQDIVKRNPPVVAIVRNPWARLWSRYKFQKKSRLNRIKLKISGQARKRKDTRHSLWFEIWAYLNLYIKGFNKWVLTDKTPRYHDGTCFKNKDQLSYLECEDFPQKIHYIRFEEFNKDIKNIPVLKDVEQWNFRSEASGEYRNQYNDKTKQYIFDNFERDIKKFNYKF